MNFKSSTLQVITRARCSGLQTWRSLSPCHLPFGVRQLTWQTKNLKWHFFFFFLLKWQGLDTKGAGSNDMFPCKLQTHNVSESAGSVWCVCVCVPPLVFSRWTSNTEAAADNTHNVTSPGFCCNPLRSPEAPFQMTPISPDFKNSDCPLARFCPLAHLFVCLTKWKAGAVMGARGGHD